MSDLARPGGSQDVEVDFARLVEQLPLVVYVDALDDVSSAIYMSPQIEPLLGYSVQEWLDDPELFVKLLHPDDRERVVSHVQRTNELNQLFQDEYRLVARDGTVRWFEDHAIVIEPDVASPGYAAGYMVDITERKRVDAERELLVEERGHLRAELDRRDEAARVLEHVGDGVVFVDGKGCVRIWNEAAAAILGVPAGDALAEAIEELVPGWGAVTERVAVRDPSYAIGRREAVAVDVQGREHWLAVSAVRFADGTIYTFRDFTEQRALEEARKDFLAIASHELRTPLATVYGAAQTLLHRDATDENRRVLLTHIVRESERVTAVLDQLLLASRLDSGTATLAQETCDLTALAGEVVEEVRARAPDTSFFARLPDDAVYVAADAQALRSVVHNLVDNAVKYGRREVAVGLEPAGPDVRLVVADDGPGIPPSEVERVFEKFYRLDPTLSGGVGGTGLGLYICRELVEAMGGRIEVGPSDAGGAAFTCRLPRIEGGLRSATQVG